MKKHIILLCFSIFLFLYFIGCASSKYNYGWEQVYLKNYSEAVSVFKNQLLKDRANYSSNYGLGVAYYFTNQLDEAIKYLEEANSLKLTNTEVKYYLGLCFEVKKDYKNAIKYYQYYNDKTLDGAYRKEMEERLVHAIQSLYQEQVKTLIDEEKSIGKNLSDSTVAILTFENRSGESDYDALETGFPTMFITDFSYVQKLKIVERLRMQAILDELKLSQSNLVETNTLQRVGKLLRAKNILKGGFIISNNKELRLDLALINVETGKISEQIDKSGSLNDFYRIEKDIVLDVVGRMGIQLTEQVRQKILTIPTESFFEFLERIKSLNRIEKNAPPNPSYVLHEAFELNLSNVRLNNLESSVSDQRDDPRDEIIIQSLPNPPQPPQK
jgi:TolB-like protein